MDRKPKTGSTAKRSAKAIPKKTKETQKERFIKAARSIGVDETGKEFNDALAIILPAVLSQKRKNR